MSDLTTEILIDIRNELRANNEEIRANREEIRGTNKRLDRVVEEQIRQGTAVIELQAGQRDMKDALLGVVHEVRRLSTEVGGLNKRIDNVLVGGMGQTVREHESRIQRLEEHSGLGPFQK